MATGIGETLEALVDKHGLDAVLGELATVCGEKADHCRAAWGDEALARAWERAARRIAKACAPEAL